MLESFSMDKNDENKENNACMHASTGLDHHVEVML